MDESPANTNSADRGAGSSTPADSPATDSLWDVLRHRHFRTIWFAAFFSYLGNWFEFVGTQWLVTELTGSTLWLSWLGAAQLAPTLVFGLLGGIVADRVNRRTLLLVTQFAMMVIAAGFALVAFLKIANLWVLLALALAQGIAVAFNAPAWQVLTPRLVPRGEIVKAVTIQGISFNVARAIGPAIAGVLMGFSGAQLLFGLNAISFIGVMLAIMTTPNAPAPQSAQGLWDLRQVKKDTREALSFVWHQPGPRAAFLATVAFALLATPVLRFLPLFVDHVYHLQEKTFGILTGVMGIGAVSGGFMLQRVPKWYPKHHLIPLSVFMGGIWILVFSLATNAWIAGVFMFFVGIFWMWAFNSSMGAMQVLVPDAMRGRVLSVCNVAAIGLMPLGAFLASAVGELSSAAVKRANPSLWDDGLATQVGVGFVALLLVGAGTVMLIWRTPEVDGLKPGEPGHSRIPGLWRGITAALHRPGNDRLCPKCFYPNPAQNGVKLRCAECGFEDPLVDTRPRGERA